MSDNRNEVKQRVLKFINDRFDDADFASVDAIIRNAGVASITSDRGRWPSVGRDPSDFDKRYPGAGQIKVSY